MFLAPQTSENLQQVALSVIVICIAKPVQGEDWAAGQNRISEISIEEFLGRLRVQSASAQLTARGYFNFRASMREAFKQKMKHKDGYDVGTLSPATSNDFQKCSERALQAALQQESNDELLRQELRHRSDLPGADGCFVGEPRRQMERLHRPLNVAH